MEQAIIGIVTLFVTIIYGAIAVLFTTFKIGIPIAKSNPELVQRSIQSPYLVIGLFALFFKGSDAQQIAKQIGLDSTLKKAKLLWIPFPPLMIATAFLIFRTL